MLAPDARLTPAGRFIHNVSLDDLPSLFHILRGVLSSRGNIKLRGTPKHEEPSR